MDPLEKKLEQLLELLYKAKKEEDDKKAKEDPLVAEDDKKLVKKDYFKLFKNGQWNLT
jgi:hypothetical protein